MTDAELLLAYDATCGTCRAISREVARASAGRLSVVPLDRPDVRRLRARALGEQAPWAPTLLRVNGAEVRGWSGPAMAPPLLRRLGMRHALAVITALGRLGRGEQTGVSVRLAAGVLVAARLLLTGRAPIAAARENHEAAEWAATHRDELPHEYDQVIGRPVAYQRAIFAESPPDVRSGLWIEALRRAKAACGPLTEEQRDVFDRAIELAHDERLFMEGRTPGPALEGRLAALRVDAVTMFPEPKAHRLLLRLGHVRQRAGRRVGGME
jgi:hypothetical protein